MCRMSKNITQKGSLKNNSGGEIDKVITKENKVSTKVKLSYRGVLDHLVKLIFFKH